MNRSRLIPACLLSLGALALSAQEVKLNIPGQPTAAAPAAVSPPAGAVPAPAPVFTEQQLLEEFGWIVGTQLGLTELEFTKEQTDTVVKGLLAAAAGRDAPYNLDQIRPQIGAFMQKRQAAYLARVRNQNLAEARVFFERLKGNRNVVELPSGLRYEILKPGTGPAPTVGQTAVVQFTGSLVGGQVFASTAQDGQPAEIVVQAPSQADPRGTIAGMVEGLQKIGKGGRAKLYIPPALAFGDSGGDVIPPGAALVFEVEVVDVKATPPLPAAPPVRN